MRKELNISSPAGILENFLFASEQLFDNIPDTVFFLKDLEGRYLVVNDTLVRRCGLRNKNDLLGKTAAEIFPSPFGQSFLDQDKTVLRGSGIVNGQLERHLFAHGSQGWCLTWKVVVRGIEGGIVGLAGISRDLPHLAGPSSEHRTIAKVIEYIQGNIDEQLTVKELARVSGMSAFQLDQRLKELYGVSTAQFVVRSRIEQACGKLRQTRDSISAIALVCGYGDQAAFTRQFKKSVGVTPYAYRKYRE